jgi:hypothetical protein
VLRMIIRVHVRASSDKVLRCSIDSALKNYHFA